LDFWRFANHHCNIKRSIIPVKIFVSACARELLRGHRGG